ncbi:MAG: hypothetical protein ACRC42_03570 [Mycoplasma sp.]
MKLPNNIIIFDMEVTNFSINANVLVQFSARKYCGNKLISKLNILINNPNLELSESFKQRTRISEKLIKSKGISLSGAIYEIQNFIGKETLVAYKGNLYYFEMLSYLLNKKLENELIDIVKLIGKVHRIEKFDDVSLRDIANTMKIPFDEKKWHNSYYDVSIIEKIWFKLKKKLEQEN